ncbi:unnamed protein product, partial [Meganyctiphanes norvegica]
YYQVRLLVSTEAGYPQPEKDVSWTPIRMPKVPRSSNTRQPTIKLTVTNATHILVQWSLAKFLRSTVSKYEVIYQKQVNNDTENADLDKETISDQEFIIEKE